MNPLILALDVNPEDSQNVLSEVKDFVDIVKVGSRLFTALGPKIIDVVHAAGKRVFLDLKFHDIPQTVSESCRNAVKMGVWGFTVHASGGFAMMKGAAETAREESDKNGTVKPIIFAVTVLTSLSDDDLKDTGVSGAAIGQVERLALLAKKAGIDGVVSSGREIETVRRACGKNFLSLVPGIRPGMGLDTQDQKRVMTPKAAIQLGADYLVVGRPIIEAKDRAAAAKGILEEIRTSNR